MERYRILPITECYGGMEHRLYPVVLFGPEDAVLVDCGRPGVPPYVVLRVSGTGRVLQKKIPPGRAGEDTRPYGGGRNVLSFRRGRTLAGPRAHIMRPPVYAPGTIAR